LRAFFRAAPRLLLNGLRTEVIFAKKQKGRKKTNSTIKDDNLGRDEISTKSKREQQGTRPKIVAEHAWVGNQDVDFKEADGDYLSLREEKVDQISRSRSEGLNIRT
jgi:hypothetical protein